MFELAIVILLLSLIAGGSLTFVSSKIESARIEATEERLAFVADAIKKFSKAFGRLPCPADGNLTYTNVNFGLEQPNTSLSAGDKFVCLNVDDRYAVSGTAGDFQDSGCELPRVNAADVAADGVSVAPNEYVVSGVVPTYTLNIDPKYMFDGWGRRIMYVVDECYTQHADGVNTMVDVMDLADEGFIAIYDDTTDNTVDPDGNQVGGADVLYPLTLISFGPNGHGGWPRRTPAGVGKLASDVISENEHENTEEGTGANPFDNFFIDGIMITADPNDDDDTDGDTDYFDDYVVYVSRFEINP